MAITLEEIDRKVKQEWLRNLTPAQRLEGLPAEERLQGLSVEDLIRAMPAGEILKRMPKRELAEEVLRENFQRQPTEDEIDSFMKTFKLK